MNKFELKKISDATLIMYINSVSNCLENNVYKKSDFVKPKVTYEEYLNILIKEKEKRGIKIYKSI